MILPLLELLLLPLLYLPVLFLLLLLPMLATGSPLLELLILFLPLLPLLFLLLLLLFLVIAPAPASAYLLPPTHQHLPYWGEVSPSWLRGDPVANLPPLIPPDPGVITLMLARPHDW